MNVYFCNPGTLDLNAIRIMGVSVKEAANPIGYFGTGLKFAIATLLRTGHSVKLCTGGKTYTFSARETTIRSETFPLVYMNDEALAFTTQLGKNWEVWQAYRELHSNALDEGGDTKTTYLPHYDTIITVSGPEIEDVHVRREEIFLTSKPLAVVEGLEVHAAPSRYIYYRGVRAAQVPGGKLTCFTYNITSKMKLTEDRTLASLWETELALERSIPTLQHREIAARLCTPGEEWDRGLNYAYCNAPSEEFLDAAAEQINNARCNASLRALIGSVRQKVQLFPPCSISDEEREVLIRALALIAIPLNCTLQLDDITVTETLGPGTYGLYHGGQNRIYITRQCLDNGEKFTAITLYEEWLHKHHKLKDNTREMQQFLLDRLVSLAKVRS